jgi:hypothetical protein
MFNSLQKIKFLIFVALLDNFNVMKKKITLTLLLLFIQFSFCFSQEVIGLWEIRKVEIGDKIVTPISKWTKINADGSYQSGNGWVQNSEGDWNYDENGKTFSPKETNGIRDMFGNFSVSFKQGKMLWQRDEDGENVKVTLNRIQKMPKSTADMMVGLWDVTEITEDETSIMESFDPKNRHYLFIRWDRVYVERTPNGEKSSGYWHINGHNPEITLISHNNDKEQERWIVTVSDTEMYLIGLSDSNKNREITYTRINEFPK